MEDMADTKTTILDDSAIRMDAEVLADRRKTMSKLKWGPILSGLSQMLGALGGPLFGTSLLVVVGVVPAAPAIVAAATTAAIIGGIMTIAAISINYLTARVYQDCGFDQTQVSAKMSAKSFVKELKENHIIVSVNQEKPAPAQRRDGKTWEQFVVQRSESPEIESQRTV
jgi:hypothetical protein